MQASPHRMVEHHEVKENENVMNSEKAIVKVSAHLSSGKHPNDDNTGEHCPSGKANGCQEY